MKNISRSYLILSMLFLALHVESKAQQTEENNSFGGWHFLEIGHSFKAATKWSCSFYFEHENYQYQR